MNDEELISAYVDGRMSEPERAAFEARLQTDAALRRQVAVTRLLVDQSRQVEVAPVPKNFILPRDFGKASPTPAPLPRYNLRQIFFRLGSVAAAVLFMFAVAFDTLRNTLPAAPMPMAAPAAIQAPEAAITTNVEPMTSTAEQAADAAGAMMVEGTPMNQSRAAQTDVRPGGDFTATESMSMPDESALSAKDAPAAPPQAMEAQAMEAPAAAPQSDSLLTPLRIIAGVALLIALVFGIVGWLRK